MVDVGGKSVTVRTAVAEGCVRMLRSTLEAILSGMRPRVMSSVPPDSPASCREEDLRSDSLCHPLLISKVSVDFTSDPDLPACTWKRPSAFRARGRGDGSTHRRIRRVPHSL